MAHELWPRVVCPAVGLPRLSADGSAGPTWALSWSWQSFMWSRATEGRWTWGCIQAPGQPKVFNFKRVGTRVGRGRPELRLAQPLRLLSPAAAAPTHTTSLCLCMHTCRSCQVTYFAYHQLWNGPRPYHRSNAATTSNWKAAKADKAKADKSNAPKPAKQD